MDNKLISEINEKILVEEIIKILKVDDNLIDGFGHDSAFISLISLLSMI